MREHTILARSQANPMLGRAIRYQPAIASTMVRRTFRRALYSSDSFDAILNQLGANLDVIGKWCAGTQLPEPLLGNLLRKFPKPEY